MPKRKFITPQTLLKLAQKELVKLSKEVLVVERDDLVIMFLENELSGDDGNKCVYGALTGSCWSGRATELIMKCVDPNNMIVDLQHPWLWGQSVTYDHYRVTNQLLKGKDNRYYTALEQALATHKAEVEEMIVDIFFNK